LRGWGLAQRSALSDSQRRLASLTIADAFRDWLAQHNSALSSTSLSTDQPLQVLLYRGVRDEVDTSSLFLPPLIAAEIYAPSVCGDGMDWRRVDVDTVWRRGAFGVLEPQSDQIWQPSLDTIVICPLTVFDRFGGRIGMGKGYFDRWLAECRVHLRAVIGLAFACQECEQVAMEVHDQSLEWVITEKECIACRSKS